VFDMSDKKITLERDAHGFYVLPAPADVEQVEVFPGHTIVLTPEDVERRTETQSHYERIVSTTTLPSEELLSRDSGTNSDVLHRKWYWLDFLKR
jgi:hypothetical protein